MTKVRKRKIVMMVHSLGVGGMERVVSELSNEFIKNDKLEIHIILYGIEPTLFYSLNKKIKVHQPDFLFINEKRMISTLKRMNFVRRKIKSISPDTVLSFGEYWNNLILLTTIGLKFPIYISDRSTPLKNLGNVQNMLRKYLYPIADGLIVQTEKARGIYKEKFTNFNIEVIGNPISKIDVPKSIKRENIILTVGRLIETKHVDRLVKIFSKLELMDWKLVIVGANAKQQNVKEKLEKLISYLKLENQVVFTGNQKDVSDYYLKSKILAFTSSSEGFPNVLVESMAAGLPVVAYDCMAGPSEIISNGEDGFLIPLFEDEVFKDKLEILMKNEAIREDMGAMAIKNIQRFDVNHISEKFLKVILSKN